MTEKRKRKKEVNTTKTPKPKRPRDPRIASINLEELQLRLEARSKFEKEAKTPKFLNGKDDESENDTFIRTVSNQIAAADAVGTQNWPVAGRLIEQASNGTPNLTSQNAETTVNFALGILSEAQPRDAFERMLITQMILIHNASAECVSRAFIKGQHPEAIECYLNRANKLTRTFTAQLEALNRHRGKGQQKIIVEHMTVNQTEKKSDVFPLVEGAARQKALPQSGQLLEPLRVRGGILEER